MVYSVEEIVQALDDSDRKMEDLNRRVEYNRERAQRWIQLSEERKARGQDDKAERAYLRAIDLQPSLAIPEDTFPNTPVSRNPIYVELKTNWQQYGFVDPREPGHYEVGILSNFMRERYEGKPENEIGYRGLKSPEEVLQRYPLEQFRESFMQRVMQSRS